MTEDLESLNSKEKNREENPDFRRTKLLEGLKKIKIENAELLKRLARRWP